MTGSAGVAAAAAAQSAAAAAEAHAARVAACRVAVRGYQHDAATIEQRQEYASCVAMLYPPPIDSEETIWVKVAVALLLAGFFGGAVCGWRDPSSVAETSAVGGGVLGAMAGFVTAALAIAAFGGVWFGVRILIS